MIGKLTGIWAGAEDGVALVEVGGVGYAVRVPLAALSTPEGSDICLFIHTAVREDAIDLYGFTTQEELSFFRQLTGVSGIGPKTALGVLNVADVRSLKRSIAQGDAAALTKVFGIGKKSAERIVVELRDKLSLLLSTTPHEPDTAQGNDGEILEALMSLGYRADESRQALKDIGAEGASSLQERLGAALKRLGTRRTV